MRQYIEFERRNFVSSFHTRDTYNGVLRFISDSEKARIAHGSDASVARIIEEQVRVVHRLRKTRMESLCNREPATLAAELIRCGLREGPVDIHGCSSCSRHHPH